MKRERANDITIVSGAEYAEEIRARHSDGPTSDCIDRVSVQAREALLVHVFQCACSGHEARLAVLMVVVVYSYIDAGALLLHVIAHDGGAVERVT